MAEQKNPALHFQMPLSSKQHLYPFTDTSPAILGRTSSVKHSDKMPIGLYEHVHREPCPGTYKHQSVNRAAKQKLLLEAPGKPSPLAMLPAPNRSRECQTNRGNVGQ